MMTVEYTRNDLERLRETTELIRLVDSRHGHCECIGHIDGIASKMFGFMCQNTYDTPYQRRWITCYINDIGKNIMLQSLDNNKGPKRIRYEEGLV